MFSIRPFRHQDLPQLKEFTDREIGANYYSAEELEKIFTRSQKDGVMCSLLIEDQKGAIKGIRLSYPAGQWETGKGHGLQPEKWPYPRAETAYFQSLFLSNDLQGQGWGGKVSQEALRLLQQTGAKGVVCHSWKESPNNSSTRYLQKLGFEVIAEHPRYWRDLDYDCTRCGKPPCQCTAVEMYLKIGSL